MMLERLLMMIVDTAASLLCFALLARVIMQATQASFRNALGRFVIALTDWAVRPARRIIPSAWGFDLPTFVVAWLVQCLAVVISLLLSGGLLSTSSAWGMLALLALIETARVACYVLEVAVILGAVLSWVNPYAPLAPVLATISQPLLRPFQKLIPPIGGVDLSPIALLLVLQLSLSMLQMLAAQLPAMLM
jgi:YggT family protein